MPEEVYPKVTIGGVEYYQTPTLIPVEYDPANGVFMFIGTPTGGIMAAGPLVKGDPGKFTKFEVGPQDVTPLAWDDPTPMSVEIVEVVPGSDTVSQVVRLAVAMHEGPPGEDGNTVLDPGDFEDPLPGQGIVLNPAGTAFILATPRVGKRYFPTSYSSISSGNVNGTSCVVSIPAQPFPWRPAPEGHGIVAPAGGTDVRCNLYARLNGESGGNIVGRGAGIGGVTERISIDPFRPNAVGDDWNLIGAGEGPTTVHLRVERQSGANTFTVSNDAVAFSVKVEPEQP